MLDRILGHQAGVVRGTASNDEDLVDLAQFLIGQALLVEHDAVVDDVAEQRVGDSGRLLGDLLEHEVLVATFFSGRGVPVDVKDPVVAATISRNAVEIRDAVTIGSDHDGLILAELDCLASVLDERGDIGAHEHLAVSHPEHQRRRTPRGHDGARLVGMGKDQREVTLEPTQYRQDRCREVTGILAEGIFTCDQMDGDLGVGVAGKLHPGALKLVT